MAGATALEGDEGIAGDLVGEAHAALAQDAAVAVEQNVAGQAQRLGKGAFDIGEAGGGPGAGGHELDGLVLQGALTALVAHRAVQRVVDQEELHGAGLRLGGDFAGGLRADLHALHGGHGA